MDNFNFYSPTEFVFGRQREKETGKYVKKYGGSKVLVHYGSKSAEKSGLLDTVCKSLDENGIDYIKLGGVKPNPRDVLVYEGIDICRREKIDFILAVGGGSVIDSSKAIAAGVNYSGDFWDFYIGKADIMSSLPVGTVLTISAAGSEGSGDSVITKEEGMIKRGAGSDHLRPKFSVLDPELTFSLPAYQTACGITDIMAHVYERYLTKTDNVEITDRLCESVLKTMINEAPKVIADPKDYEARANIMWAGTVAHTNVVGVGRSQDWTSHMLEHELSGLYDCAHGAGLAVIMPSFMECVYKKDLDRFVKSAVRIWNCEMDYDNPEKTALEGIKAFRRFLHNIGMPINFSELGALKEDIPVLIDKLGINNGTIGYADLDASGCKEVYETAADAVL